MSLLAGRQHGYVRHDQLLALGMSASTIQREVERGRLIHVHQGVYAVGHVDRTALGRAHAAVLACGDGAALSHDSAAALGGLKRRWPREPEITSPAEHRRPGIRAHRSRTLTRADVTTNYGMRVTTIVRTILDILPRLSDREAVRLVNDARVQHVLKPTALSHLLARSPRLRRLIDPTQNPTRSGLEDDFVRWIKRHGLPMPRINRHTSGHEVDAVFEAERVIVEVDSWDYHGNPQSFVTDRERDTAAAANGFLPLRLTPERLTRAEAIRLQRILEARR